MPGRNCILRIGAGLAVLFCGVHDSRAQQLSPPALDPSQSARQNTAPSRSAKIWTNDEVIALRTPMDLYLLEKEAQVAAEEAFTVQRLLSCFAFGDPTGTLEQTQLEIKSTTQAIEDSQEAVTQARLQLAISPEILRLRNQLEFTRRSAELDERRAKLAALQKHLAQLNGSDRRKTPNGTQAPPSPPD